MAAQDTRTKAEARQTTPAAWTNHRDAGHPTEGLWFGRAKRGASGEGRPVRFERPGRCVIVLDAATGEKVDDFGDTGKFWYAPAPAEAEATADQIEQAAIDAAHVEADFEAWAARQLRSYQGNPRIMHASRGLLGAVLHLRALRATLAHRASTATNEGRLLLAEALDLRVAELDVEIANAEYDYTVDVQQHTTVEAPPAPAVEQVDEVVIVSCGAEKLPHAAPAGELYTSAYHADNRAAAAAIAGRTGARVFILSALHGLLALDQVVEPYNLRMGQPGAVTVDQLRRQAAALGIRAARVTVLAGRAYADMVSAVWPDAARPYDGSRGLGDHRARARAIAAGELADQQAPAEAPLGSRPGLRSLLVGEQLALFPLPALDLPAGDLPLPRRPRRRGGRRLSARATVCPARLFAGVGL